jgi:hypothetical protein
MKYFTVPGFTLLGTVCCTRIQDFPQPHDTLLLTHTLSGSINADDSSAINTRGIAHTHTAQHS